MNILNVQKASKIDNQQLQQMLISSNNVNNYC